MKTRRSFLYSLPLAMTLLMGIPLAASAQDMLGTGTFEGLNGHETVGTASIVKSGDGYVVQLGADFVFDGAPDPKVALGKDGKYDPATLMGLLKGNSGEQTFQIPASIDASQYNEVHIWCEKFAVGLAVAPLN